MMQFGGYVPSAPEQENTNVHLLIRIEEIPQPYAQNLGYFADIADARVTLPLFDVADVGPMDFYSLGQLLLGHPSLASCRSQALAKALEELCLFIIHAYSLSRFGCCFYRQLVA